MIDRFTMSLTGIKEPNKETPEEVKREYALNWFKEKVLPKVGGKPEWYDLTIEEDNAIFTINKTGEKKK